MMPMFDDIGRDLEEAACVICNLLQHLLISGSVGFPSAYADELYLLICVKEERQLIRCFFFANGAQEVLPGPARVICGMEGGVNLLFAYEWQVEEGCMSDGSPGVMVLEGGGLMVRVSACLTATAMLSFTLIHLWAAAISPILFLW